MVKRKSIKSPDELRLKAKLLLSKADKLEQKRLMSIGKLVQKYEANKWQEFNPEQFKKEVAEC